MPSKNRTAMSAIDLKIVRWMLIVRPAVVSATLGVAMLLLPPGIIDKTPIVVVLGGTFLLTLLYWSVYRIKMMSRPLLAVQIAFDIFIITVIIHYTEGYDSSFVGFYFLSIMCAALFFRRAVTLLFAAFAALSYVVYIFIVGPVLDAPVPLFLRESIALQAILYSILMVTVGFLSSYFAERLRGKDTALAGAIRLLKEARLDTLDILQSMTNGLVTVDMYGRIIYLNRMAERILEVSGGLVVGRNYRVVFAARADAFADVIEKQMSTSIPTPECEVEVEDKDGSTVPLGLTAMPLFDIDGSRRGAIINFKDLTEKRKLLEMLRQSERMAAIGELSAGIAHEIRNPLAAISNAVELLRDGIGATDGRVARMVEVLDRESARLQRITTEFLQFARLRPSKADAVDLRPCVEDVLTLIAADPRAIPDVVLANAVGEGVEILFDSDQLRQLLINVVINSLDALQGRGRITITAGGDLVDLPGYVRIMVTDDGPGFPAESLGRMFEPFYSTKPEGTGLGLALVRKIVIANNGRIFAGNRETGGAEITVDVPAHGGPRR